MQTIPKPVETENSIDRQSGRSPIKADKRLFSIEFLRVYATVQVLLIHASGPWVAVLGAKNPWWAACLIDSFARPAVPIFLMISGMLLLSEEYDKGDSLGEFLRKRLSRVFVPLVVWSLIYIGFRYLHHDPSLHPSKIVSLLNTPAFYHLGFLYCLGGLYLAAPVLRVIVRHAPGKEVHYLVGLWFVAECLSPLVGYFTGFKLPTTFALTGGSVGYFVLGYLLRKTKLEGRKLGWAFFVIACCITCTVVGTYMLTKSDPTGNVNQLFFEYWNPIIVIYATLTFVALRSMKLRLTENLDRTCRSAIASIAAASFTIYLVHPLIIENLRTSLWFLILLPGNKFCTTALAIFAIAATTCGASWLIFMIGRKLRVPAWIIP